MSTRARRLPADLGPRIAVAAPAAAVAVAAIALGGPAFAVLLVALGLVAVHELHGLARGALLRAPAAAAVLALVAVALAGDREALAAVVLAALGALLAAALAAGRREGLSAAIAFSVLAVVWIGLPLAHAVLLRELPHGGGLVVAALLGTFLGDTAAHLAGTAVGRRPLAPHVSPSKTVEGLVAGMAGAVVTVWLVAELFQPWLAGWRALVLGAAVAVAAPAGDLFESLLKRDAGVKDTGRLLGPHGGVLDRLDAALFAVPAAYFVALAVL